MENYLELRNASCVLNLSLLNIRHGLIAFLSKKDERINEL